MNLAIGAFVGITGAALICACDVARSCRSLPPKRLPMMGVTRWKWPVTFTATVSPSAGVVGHGDVEQVTVTSAAATVTKLPLASLIVRHITRFES